MEDEHSKNIVTTPNAISVRAAEWRKLFKLANKLHYLFGVLGVLASTAAAAAVHAYPDAAIVFSTLSAACMAIIGFARPDRIYLKFVAAWRILDIAIIRYEAGIIDRTALIAAVEVGESGISNFELENNSTLIDRRNAASLLPEPASETFDNSVMPSTPASDSTPRELETPRLVQPLDQRPSQV